MIMLKKIGKGLTKFLGKTLVGRVVDNVVLGGAVSSTQSKTNYTNEGKFDIKEVVLTLVTSSIPVLILIAIIKGWVTIEQAKEIFSFLTP